MTKMSVFGAVAAVAAMAALPAAATAPGENGRIAFMRDAGHLLFTVNPDGTGLRRLPVRFDCCPRWSADGKKIAVSYDTKDGRVTYATMGASGLNFRVLSIPDPTLSLGCGPWSPDGARFACDGWDDKHAGRNGLYTIRSSDGGGLVRVTSNPYGGHDNAGDYSPDGKRIVFARSDAQGKGVGLFVVDADGTGLKRITPAGTLLTDAVSGNWSPQGNEILFSRHRTADVHSSLWGIRADGTGLRQIQVQGLACGGRDDDPNGISCFDPRWSPDGTKIVFGSGKGHRSNGDTFNNVYVINRDGSGLTRVTHGNTDSVADWGPQAAGR
jgi:Tol biopolymer transport system component